MKIKLSIYYIICSPIRRTIYLVLLIVRLLECLLLLLSSSTPRIVTIIIIVIIILCGGSFAWARNSRDVLHCCNNIFARLARTPILIYRAVPGHPVIIISQRSIEPVFSSFSPLGLKEFLTFFWVTDPFDGT